MLYVNVKKLCQKQGITFAQLEKSLGFGNGTIRKWDTSSPSVDKLEKIADYFQLSTDVLLGRGERS